MKTKKFEQWTIPAEEAHLPVWMYANNDRRHGRLTYQAHKYDAVMKRVTQRNIAIDVGGHMGMWSWLMSKDFDTVIAFEPVELHRECFVENTADCKNISLHPYALGATHGHVSMKTWTEHSTGDTGIEMGAIGDTPMIRLDDIAFSSPVGLIKIDCEGYEANVVKGARDTIVVHKPIIIVEQKGNMSGRYGIPQQEAVTFLTSLGMRVRDCISGDFIMDWPE
jgi:FkbM family methyltransferase